MSKRTIKRVLRTLEEGSKSVRSAPSEENYRKWERELEKAAGVPVYTYVLIGISVLLVVASVIAFGGEEDSPSGNTYTLPSQETRGGYTSYPVIATAIPTYIYPTNTPLPMPTNTPWRYSSSS